MTTSIDFHAGEKQGTGQGRNPFPGPQAYIREESAYFFGRDDEIAELTSLILTSSATLLYAPSGAGKTSLLEAGVIPHLESRSRVVVLPTARLGTGTTPAGEPTGESVAGNPFLRAVCEKVRHTSGRASEDLDLAAAVQPYRMTPTGRALLVLDQFEEVFNEPSLWREREEFFDALTRTLEENTWLRVVIALRSDYLAELVPYGAHLPGRLAVRYQLRSLDEHQARTAIAQAFDASGMPLHDDELDRLIELLVTDPAQPAVRAQHVNAIRLQIVCRRLWQERSEHAGEPTGGVLSPGFSIEQSMVQYVDEAVAAVARIHGDEGLIRWWLRTNLITPHGRRAFVLVGDEETAGLANDIVTALVNVKLIQLESRHGSRLAELTHDSMVEAVRSSNAEWLRAHERRRRRASLALLCVLVFLLLLFPLLLQPRSQTTLAYTSGSFGREPVRIGFTAVSDGTLVQTWLGAASGVTLELLEQQDDGSLEPVRPLEDVDLLATAADPDAPTTAPSGIYDVAFRSEPDTEYVAVLTAGSGGDTPGSYNVTISALSVARLDRGGTATVTSQLVGLPLEQGREQIITVGSARLSDVTGVEILAVDYNGGWAVVTSTVRGAIAVLTLDDEFYGGPPSAATVRVADVSPSIDLRAGRPTEVTVEDSSDGADVVSLSFTAEESGPPIGAELLCSDYVRVHFLGQTNEATWSGTGVDVYGGQQSTLPLDVEPGEHTIFLASEFSPVSCTVGVRAFGADPLTTFGGHDIPLTAGTNAAARLVEVSRDAVLVAPQLPGVTLTSDCGSSRMQSEGDGDRYLAYIPGEVRCTFWATSETTFSETVLPVWLAEAEAGEGG
jgi:hypothetical protein